jgi:hypothetical protein
MPAVVGLEPSFNDKLRDGRRNHGVVMLERVSVRLASGEIWSGDFDTECGQFVPPAELTYSPQGGVAMLASGAAGVVRAVTGAGGASRELIDSRLAVCGTCPHAVVVGGLFRQCSICKCATWAKVRNVNERCPAGKW